jgi:CheY-like chemotaxis protein
MMNSKLDRAFRGTTYSPRGHDDVLGRLSVLVVDDDASSADLITEEIRDRGYAADAAYDGQHALSALASRRYGVIVSDLAMPLVGGAELLERVRGNPRLDAGFILVSSHPESIVQKAATGYDAFLRKPVAFDALVRLIESVFMRRHRPGLAPR